MDKHPMDPIVLTPHQQQALEWLVEQVLADAPLIALRGLAGTGKTSLLPALQAALQAVEIPTTLGAPTHRAAMILRQKGLDADTIHAQALVAYFTADYRRACEWLGESLPVRLGDTTQPRPDVDGLPWLVHEAVNPDLARGHVLQRQPKYTAKRRLASIGISGKDHFDGWTAKAGQGLLIIDEASMVGQHMLALCQEAFPHIILIGDPGQLPPVKDTAVLLDAPGIELTEVHRQAQDSPIIGLAMAARAGQPFWHTIPTDPLLVGHPIRALEEVSASRFLVSPLLVWRNVTRTTSTQAIRSALGYPSDRPVQGEPLVCRSTSREDRALGFFNNGLYTVQSIPTPDDPRHVVVKDALGDEQLIRVHIEELDGDHIDPRAVPFRFGYCLTVHTAQGGEWPRVYVSLPDLRAHAGFTRQQACPEDFQRWAYTAITRAKDTLRFLSSHTFNTPEKRTRAMADIPNKTNTTTIAPPSAPLLTAIPTTDIPTLELEDDIPDVAVPQTLQDALQATPEVSPAPTPSTTAALSIGNPERPERDKTLTPHEQLLPLIQGFCDIVQKKIEIATQDHYREMTRELAKCWQATEQGLEKLRDKNDHVLYQLSNTLEAYHTKGLPVQPVHPSADIRFFSPNGYPITVHLTGTTQDDLLGQLKTLTDWLGAKGCKPGD